MFSANFQARLLTLLAERRLVREEGQALVEYALIISFIAIVAVFAVRILGTQVAGLLSQVSSGF